MNTCLPIKTTEATRRWVTHLKSEVLMDGLQQNRVKYCGCTTTK